MNKQSGVTQALGDYVRSIFDLNKDGAVTVKEFFSVLIPNYAVGISLIVIDLLVLLAEYRVWDVARQITGDPFKALGFVAVSAIPFYLAQVLWLYPRAHGLQQGIALAMGAISLYTSAQFGLADLTRQYDVNGLFSLVVWLTVFYVVILLVYVVSDRSIRLFRTRVQAHDRAAFQKQMNDTARGVLSDLRLQLEEERKLRMEFGDEAVEAHLSMLNHRKPPARPQFTATSPAPVHVVRGDDQAPGEPGNPQKPPLQE